MTPPRRRALRRICGAALLCLSLQPAAGRAETRDEGVFDFYIKGFRVGILVFAGVEAGDYYAVNGRFSTTGTSGLIPSVQYAAEVRGSLKSDGFSPQSYTLTTDPGAAQKVEEMTYRNGAPQRIVRSPPGQGGAPALDPAAEGGTVDTLTAVYQLLRSIPAARACKARITIFDGRRRSRLTLWAADSDDAGLSCGGEYRRVSGYSAKEMKRQSFPFTLHYEDAGDGELQVDDISMTTSYGPARLKRR